MSVPKTVTPAVPLPLPAPASPHQRLRSLASRPRIMMGLPPSGPGLTERRPRNPFEGTPPAPLLTPLSVPLSNVDDSLPPELEAMLKEESTSGCSDDSACAGRLRPCCFRASETSAVGSRAHARLRCPRARCG